MSSRTGRSSTGSRSSISPTPVVQGAVRRHRHASALRRSYRKWVAELVERDPVPPTAYSMPLSSRPKSACSSATTRWCHCSGAVGTRLPRPHEAQLLANDRAILKRVIHLLRVACVKSPEWLAGFSAGPRSILNVPDGSAWAAVLRLVHRNLTTFAPQERVLLLGFVEDAVRGVSWWAPDIDAAEVVAGIAHWLLDGLRGYGGEEPRRRVLEVIAKIPRADPVRFAATLRGQSRKANAATDLGEFPRTDFRGHSGCPPRATCRTSSLPSAPITCWPRKRTSRRAPLRARPLDIDLYFGIKEGLRHDSFPPSAIRGPWGQLLRHHRTKALDFYTSVFNHVADWYAHPRLHQRLEPPWEVELTFADGTTRKQWFNPPLGPLPRHDGRPLSA